MRLMSLMSLMRLMRLKFWGTLGTDCHNSYTCVHMRFFGMLVSKGNFMGVPSSASVCPDPEALLVSTVCTYEVFPIITIVSKAFISGYPLIFVRVSKKSQGNSLDVYFLVGFRVISGFQRFSNDGSQEAWSTVSQLFQKETLWGCRNPKGVLWICWLNWESFKFACDYALLLFTNKGKWPASYIYSHIYAYNITHTYMYIYVHMRVFGMLVSKGNFMGVPSSASVCPDPEALLVSTTV